MLATRNKYHAQPTVVNGIRFASKKEANRYLELKALENQYKIQNLNIQVKFPLIKKSQYGKEIRYVADFVYYVNGEMIVEDTKGYVTDVFKLKARMMAELYGIKIHII